MWWGQSGEMDALVAGCWHGEQGVSSYADEVVCLESPVPSYGQQGATASAFRVTGLDILEHRGLAASCCSQDGDLESLGWLRRCARGRGRVVFHQIVHPTGGPRDRSSRRTGCRPRYHPGTAGRSLATQLQARESSFEGAISTLSARGNQACSSGILEMVSLLSSFANTGMEG